MRTDCRLLGSVLIGIAIGWFGTRGDGREARVEASESASDSQVVSFTTQGAGGQQFLYLIDPTQKVLSVYEFNPRSSKLKLSAVRHYSADHRLSEFNNEPPNVADIEKLVRQR